MITSGSGGKKWEYMFGVVRKKEKAKELVEKWEKEGYVWCFYEEDKTLGFMAYGIKDKAGKKSEEEVKEELKKLKEEWKRKIREKSGFELEFFEFCEKKYEEQVEAE